MNLWKVVWFSVFFTSFFAVMLGTMYGILVLAKSPVGRRREYVVLCAAVLSAALLGSLGCGIATEAGFSQLGVPILAIAVGMGLLVTRVMKRRFVAKR